MQVTPIPREALVRARVRRKSDHVEVIGVLLGRMTRVGGVPLAAEIEVVEGAGEIGRITLADAKHVVALNDAARDLMRDAGPTARAA